MRWPRGVAPWVWIALLATVASLPLSVTIGSAVTRRDPAFPHDKHARVFPSCSGCHEGITTGDSTAFYPAVETCAQCHTGRDSLKAVQWARPAHRPTNLAFAHARHATAARQDSAALDCSSCHRTPGRTEWMHVGTAMPETCAGCHAHPAKAHLAEDNICQSCHVSLTQARAIPAARIAAWSRPPSHDRPDFLSNHKPAQETAQAQCAFCHARETCARCHLNVASLPKSMQLEPDPRVAMLVAGLPARYSTPASHGRTGFLFEHGKAATANAQQCASCHTQPSCKSCHTGPGAAKVIARLPKPVKGGAPGVVIRVREDWSSSSSAASPTDQRAAWSGHAETSARPSPPTRVHPPGFAREHGPQAAGGQMSCAGCHSERSCADCHVGEGRRRFHAANFVAKHPVESYGRERDCASCHNPEVFCKDCHQSSGLAAKGRLDVAFHNAQPQWLLQHGRAARQALESCTSCHKQLDCMQCHSTQGWGVSPHGPDFNAARMGRRAKSSCALCHPSDPLKR